jgi:hypothetical protein
VIISKPDAVYDRDVEWAALSRFVSDPRPGTRLAIVYGRRRQGKTMLLEALRDATGGFYWQARQQSSTQNLVSLSQALTAFAGPGATPVRLLDWEEAVTALANLGASRPSPLPVLVDEVGYLIDAVPGLASIVQAALTPLGAARRAGGARLVLCGSSFGQMRRLVAADAPLRGRIDVELVVRPFDHRAAAQFWGLDANPDAAFRLHALVGGTPAYLEFAGEGPGDGDIDRWAARHLLEQSSPLYREGRVVVAEDPALVDQALHWAVLGAIADGAVRRGELAAALGRAPTSLHHVLSTLVSAGWVVDEPDPLRAKRTRFVLDEPMVRTYRLVVEPNESRLALRRDAAAAVWEDLRPVVHSRIYGPHLERLARVWAGGFAAEATLDARLSQVGPTMVGAGGRALQLDLVGMETTTRGKRRVAVVGEVKAEAVPIGPAELARLDAAVETVGAASATVKRLLVSRGGFTAELRRVARRRGDVELVDLHRLYHGD